MGFKKILSEVFTFAAGGEQLQWLADSAGIGAEKLQLYGNAIKNYGGNMASVSATFANLNQQLQDMKFGRGGGAINDAAIRYGVDISANNAEGMLINIARRMETLNNMEKLDLGKKLGLDRATIAFLSQGVRSVTAELERAKEFNLYSEEDIKASREFQIALRQLQQSFNMVWGVVARAVIPIITKFFEVIGTVTRFLSQHKGFVLGFLGSVAAALGVIAVKSMIATAPIWLMFAAIMAIGAAIGLVVDDIQTFLEGGDSLFGALLDAADDVLNMLDNITAEIILLFMDAWETVKTGFMDMFNGVKDYVLSIWPEVVAGLVGGLNWLIEKVNAITKFIPYMPQIDTIKTGQSAIDGTKTPLASMTNNTISSTAANNNTNNNVHIGEITVNTAATSGAAVASGIGDALRDELKDLLSNNTSGAAI